MTLQQLINNCRIQIFIILLDRSYAEVYRGMIEDVPETLFEYEIDVICPIGNGILKVTIRKEHEE